MCYDVFSNSEAMNNMTLISESRNGKNISNRKVLPYVDESSFLYTYPR